ncbi:MAG: ExeM/NucH family extracellular endonuclease, partial [Cyanobacteriota bacterium]|nr:ExeM/NucH family extracellular endonuclease [Cyanobacteriota bacterium]
LGTTGFFVQEEDSDTDDDPATSEGLFVFDPNFLEEVEIGDRIQVTGEVEEFFNKTELTNISDLNVVEMGVLDEVTAATVDLPVSDIDNLEAFEGMLVSFADSLTVTDSFNLGRFGEITLSVPEALSTPTDSIDPNDDPASGTNFEGDSNVEAVLAQEDLNRRSQIILNDGSQADANDLEDPLGGEFGTTPVPYINRTEGEATTIRRGTTVENLTGVLDFSFGRYRVQRNPYDPTDVLNEEFPLEFDYAERPEVPEVGGTLTVASFNVLNYFTTIDNGENTSGPSNSSPRGADSEAEFERQQAKIVSALVEIDADVVGLVEIENNGDEAISNLVDALNAEYGAETYDFISDPPNFNEVAGSTDAIKVGMIYKPDAVTPVGEAKTTDSEAFAFPPGGRAPVAQTFEADGEQFTVMVNHFKSKGGNGEGEDADQNDGQGDFNATRKAQAQAVADFVEELQAETGDNDILVLGDLNAYGQEDPIDLLRSEGLVDELDRFVEDPYSFVFFGEAGYLDHALSTPSLSSQVTGAAAWYINADEPRTLDYNDIIDDNPDDRFESINPDPSLYAPDPFRSSDHDPVIVGLDLFGNIIEGTTESDRLVGDETDDRIFARAGNDTVAGGLGDDEIFGEEDDDILRGDLDSRQSQVNLVGGNDTISGGAGNDRIGGKAGNDQLFGDEGDDQIWGDDGDDLIRGGLGNDILLGDDFSGGEGSDTFILAVGEGTDTIVDFEVGVDLIGLADGLTAEMLSISTQGNNTIIAVGDETLATLNGVTDLSDDSFSLI